MLAALEAAAGWQTERVQRPVLILGQLDGILTGIRQLRRTRPLDTEEIAGLRVPTLAGMARIKAAVERLGTPACARPVLGRASRGLLAAGVVMERSRALWNRRSLDLSSDEVLAQILDRGSLQDWRVLYRLAARDRALRVRIQRIVTTVPLPLPRFWLAALASLGELVDWDVQVPAYYDSTGI